VYLVPQQCFFDMTAAGNLNDQKLVAAGGWHAGDFVYSMP
jgi:hypothetical protein